MAKYTFTVRELCSTFGQDEVQSWFEDYDLYAYLTNEQVQVINETGVFDPHYLSQMIIEHYYLRESSLETPALFRMKAGVKMRELMERYAPLIYSASIKIDPLVNVDFKETFERDTAGSSSSKTNGSGLAINSDTPQGKINKADILNGTYATSTGANEATSSGEDSSQGHETYTKHTKGNSGISTTAQALIKQYREIIVPINYDIIEEMEELFMSIF